MSAKDLVYAALPPDGLVAGAYREGRLGDLVSDVLERCPGIGFAEAATVLLHYLLSVLGVPSQRRVEAGGAELDIVVPDLRALRRRPGAALVVCILESPGQADIRAAEAARVQPDPRLVWMVCESDVPGYRTFAGAGIAELPGAASGFLEDVGSGRLRVLGSRP